MTVWASASNAFQVAVPQAGPGEDADAITSQLEKRYPALVSWPADAQLAILYWAYKNSDGAGVNFSSPQAKQLFSSLRQLVPDFDAAANLATWPNQSLSDKAMITQLFQNAADVITDDLDQSKLYYPGFPPGSYQAPSGPGNLLMTALVATGVGVAGWLAWGKLTEKKVESVPPVAIHVE